jgi:hypothetical protein
MGREEVRLAGDEQDGSERVSEVAGPVPVNEDQEHGRPGEAATIARLIPSEHQFMEKSHE